MAALKTLIFMIVVPGVVVGIVPWLLLQQSGGGVVVIPSIWLLGLIPLLLGIGLALWCAGVFAFIGKGTPAPFDAPKVLVQRGAYRWVRNPIYIAVVSVVIGEAILFHSLLLVGYALLLWAIFHTFVVFFEEPTLRRQFGASYEMYMKTVSRWLPHFSHG